MANYDPLSLPNNSLNNASIGPSELTSEVKSPDYIPQAPVVKTPGEVKSRGIIRTAVEDAASEALKNYIVPSALEFGYNIVTGFFGLLFKQDPKRYSPRGAYEPPRGTWVSYRDAYNDRGQIQRQRSSRLETEANIQRGKVDVRIMEYASYADAMDVRDVIEEWFNTYHCVSVLRVYEWSDRAYEAPITANDWGWYDISGLSVREDRNTGKGYIIFPRVVQLKGG